MITGSIHPRCSKQKASSEATHAECLYSFCTFASNEERVLSHALISEAPLLTPIVLLQWYRLTGLHVATTHMGVPYNSNKLH